MWHLLTKSLLFTKIYPNYFLWIFHSFISSFFSPINSTPTSCTRRESHRRLITSQRRWGWANNLQVITLSNNHKSIYSMMRRGRQKNLLFLLSRKRKRRRSDITIFNEGRNEKILENFSILQTGGGSEVLLGFYKYFYSWVNSWVNFENLFYFQGIMIVLKFQHGNVKKRFVKEFWASDNFELQLKISMRFARSFIN